jgi:hypothetical protein
MLVDPIGIRDLRLVKPQTSFAKSNRVPVSDMRLSGNLLSCKRYPTCPREFLDIPAPGQDKLIRTTSRVHPLLKLVDEAKVRGSKDTCGLEAPMKIGSEGLL